MMKQSKFVIIGRDGMIGRRLIERIKNLPHHFIATTRRETLDESDISFDLERPEEFPAELLGRGDTAIFLAAISSPDVCTNQYTYAYGINVTSTVRVIEQCLARGARVLFFSSDTVYGETSHKLDESDPLSPMGVYAEMKAEVERHFDKQDGFKSARLSYVIAAEDKFSRYLKSCHVNGAIAEVYDPLVRCPVAIDDVVDGCLQISDNWDAVDSKAVNFAGPESLSRVDIAEIYKETVLPGLQYQVVMPEKAFYNSRPKIINISSELFKYVLGRQPLTIRRAIEHSDIE